MRTLDKVKIEGFKSIATAEIELSDLNVVIGANGSGKSNLIGVFRFLERVLAKNLRLYTGEQGGAERFLFHGRKVTPALEIRFDFSQNAYGFRLKPALGDTLIFESEGVGCWGDWEYEGQYGFGHKESLLEDAVKHDKSKVPRYIYPKVKDWVVYHFHDTSDTAASKRFCDLDDNRFLRPDASNLAAFLWLLQEQHPRMYGHIVEHVRLVAPFFDDFALNPSAVNPGKIKLEWRQKGSAAYFDGYSLSDGTLRFIALAALLLQPSPPSLILLDEPELGLHPFAIRILAEMLGAAAKRTQILIATQSVTLLNNFTPKDVIVAEHDGFKTVFQRLDEEKLRSWLAEFGLGELWEKNALGGAP